MDAISWITIGLIIVIVIQGLRLLFADCDLSLQWAEKFGKSPAILEQKVVWITGASSGLGEFLSYELAAVRCRLILSARREEELQRVKKQCLLSGSLRDADVLVLPLDMLKFDTHSDAVEKVLAHFSKIDILVNNAGRTQRATWDQISLDVDREIFELNVFGVLSLTRAVLPYMRERKSGHIVVSSSIAGKLGVPFSASYTGTKHALQGYFESLRLEAADSNIDVTLICPGPVFSHLLENAFTNEVGKSNEKRMKTSRCAALMAVSIANRIDEAWISNHLSLLFMYIYQYMPSLARRIIVHVGMKRILKIREGQ